jgi:hypothetical protein
MSRRFRSCVRELLQRSSPGTGDVASVDSGRQALASSHAAIAVGDAVYRLRPLDSITKLSERVPLGRALARCRALLANRGGVGNLTTDELSELGPLVQQIAAIVVDAPEDVRARWNLGEVHALQIADAFALLIKETHGGAQ